MTFHHPEFLAALLLLPPLALLYVVRVRLGQHRIKKRLGQQAGFLSLSVSPAKRHIKTGLRIGALTLLVLALSRPQSTGETIEIQSKGIYLLLLVDGSLSMLAEDVKPSRLAFMKREISRLIDMSPGDQIALVFFAGSASLMTPFTHDLSVVRSYLNDLSHDQAGRQGTNFEEAFRLSAKIFDRIKEPQKEKAVKAIVLASDGEDHPTGNRQTVKDLFSKQDVRVFSISFGTKRGGVIPVKDREGRLWEYKKDRHGDLVLTRLRPESLKKFARWGRGAYYHADYGGKAVENLRRDLNLLKKSLFAGKAYSKKREHYQWLLLLAFFMALVERLLTDRARLSPRPLSGKA